MDDQEAIAHMRDERAHFNVRYYRHADATKASLDIDEAYQRAISAIETLAKARAFIGKERTDFISANDALIALMEILRP